MNTDQIDRITPSERIALRGFCEPCKLWTEFVRGTDKEACSACGGGFTNKTGYQATTQRTPLIKSAKLTKKDSAA